MRVVEDELAAYGQQLAGKPRLVALNKVDLADPELAAAFAEELKAAGAARVFPISGATGAGIDRLLDAVLDYLPARTVTEVPGEVASEGEEKPWSPLD
jgi:GTP-binding protein